LLFLDYFGLLGTIPYVALIALMLRNGYLGWRRAISPLAATLSLAVLTFTIALAVFNVAAGSYFHFQIMAIYWPLAGFAGAAILQARAREADIKITDGLQLATGAH